MTADRPWSFAGPSVTSRLNTSRVGREAGGDVLHAVEHLVDGVLIGGQVVEHAGDGVLHPGQLARVLRERLVDVDHGGLQRADRAAGHQVRHRPQEVFDVVGGRGVAQRDGVAVAQYRPGLVIRRKQRDIDVAERGGLAKLGAGVGGKLGIAGYFDVGDRRGALELDAVEHTDLHPAGVHLGPGGQVEHAGELDLDVVGVARGVGARDRQPGRIQRARRGEAEGHRGQQYAERAHRSSGHDSAAPRTRLVRPRVIGSVGVPDAHAAAAPGILRSFSPSQMAPACVGAIDTCGGI